MNLFLQETSVTEIRVQPTRPTSVSGIVQLREGAANGKRSLHNGMAVRQARQAAYDEPAPYVCFKSHTQAKWIRDYRCVPHMWPCLHGLRCLSLG